MKQRTFPNQGIWSSMKNSVKIGLIYGLISGLIFGLLGLSYGLISGLIIGLLEGVGGGLVIGLIFGVLGGLLGALLNGGTTCIQHFNLRRILYRKGFMPWNCARFLDYASERLLMKKVGGGYAFYHRMLMEHFAGIKQVAPPANTVAIAQPSTTVPNYLTCSNCGHQNPTINKFCNKCGTRLS
ncbi:MAG: zinc-ribbon domain-containing protein [Cyanobacteria bacterium J06641_2]